MKNFLTILLIATPVFAAIDLDNTVVKIKPTHSTRCLNSMNKSNSQGAVIVQWSCSDQQHQRFLLTRNADGFYSIQSKGSNLCFGVPNAFSGSDGITLLQVACNSSAYQSTEFAILPAGEDTYTIRARRALQTCLGVVNGSQNMFASVVQEKCENKPSEIFRLVKE